MASYPAYKWGHNYLASCWIVARATAFPFLFVAIRIATERNHNHGLRMILGIFYLGSLLAIGKWFLGPLYPFPEVLAIMLFGLIPFIFWGKPYTREEMYDTDRSPRIRSL